MLACNQETMDLFQHLGPVQILDREAGTVEIEVAIPTAGVAPELGELLGLAASTMSRCLPRVAPAVEPPSEGTSDAAQRRLLGLAVLAIGDVACHRAHQPLLDVALSGCP